jgi:2-polyprenyl-3-methyl-5-hydroxy-6-metoxy-1,4-benzoquinol methylase
MKCTACKSEDVKTVGNKSGIEYKKCQNCKTIFSKELDQAGMVGGGYVYERSLQNADRLVRFRELCGDKFTLIDWGCGNGELVKYALDHGVNAIGYDKYSEAYSALPKEKADVISLIEVIEHMAGQHLEKAFKSMIKYIKPNGFLYIETCFSDVCGFDSFYVEPAVGHSTIWSYQGIDIFLTKNGWVKHNTINSTVLVYKKA